jgi:hypothetical protein
VHELVEKLPLPFVVHFRIATVGGVTTELTHPFPVTETANAMSGRLRGGAVVFHNGHWQDWKDTLLRSLTADGHAKLPGGVWSDSRAMALLAYRHGTNVLKLIDAGQRIVVFDRDGVTRHGRDWTKVDGLWLSNTRGLMLTTPQSSFKPAWTANTRGTTFGGGPRYLRPADTFLTPESAQVHRALLESDERDLVEQERLFEEEYACDVPPNDLTFEPEDDGSPEAVDVAMAQRRGKRIRTR